jgi:organic radical activating enzyme
LASIIEIKQKIPALYLTWVINNICTNSCSYCPSILHSGSNHNYDWSHAEEFINRILVQYPKIHLAVSGGEPTLSPWFKDLVKKFSDAGHPVGITTNGARTVGYFEDISQHLSYVVMSYHPSFEDPELLEKALACAKHTSVSISIMMDSRYFDQSLEAYYKFSKYAQLSVEHVKIQSWRAKTHEGSEYTDSQIEIMNSLPTVSAKKSILTKVSGYISGKVSGYIGGYARYDDGTTSILNAQNLINSGETNFRDWSCNIGLESLYVSYDGIIRNGNCVTSPVIGTIQNLELAKWPSDPVICRQNYCNCSTDVYVSKKKYRS